MVPRLSEFSTDRFCSKAWITPENEIIPLTTLHYEYFRNPVISQRYGVPFSEEIPTRLAALRVGFVRMNYQKNGGLLTIESMRWDPALEDLINHFIAVNAEWLDMVRVHILNDGGTATQVEVNSVVGFQSSR